MLFFFKQVTAYEMRISDWSSDVCSSDLRVVFKSPASAQTAGAPVKAAGPARFAPAKFVPVRFAAWGLLDGGVAGGEAPQRDRQVDAFALARRDACLRLTAGLEGIHRAIVQQQRSEEQTSELQSLKRISYAV